jgi:hypothetical protein
VLERQRPVLEAPPAGAEGHPLWGEYVAYYEKRLGELRRGEAAKPPLGWGGYEQMRGQFGRGLVFERYMAEVLRVDAALPRGQRRFLGDFEEPRVETYVGVAKPGKPGVRYADVLVLEGRTPKGQVPRVETFSFKSRDLRLLDEEALTARITVDASAAWKYYGEVLDIRRKSLKLVGKAVPVHRVRLIYEGGALKPSLSSKDLGKAKGKAESKAKGVEVLFQ